MCKTLRSFLLIASMLLLTSCSLAGVPMAGRFFVDRDDELADERLEQVLEAIENQDKDALKGLFSKRALEETADFDAGAEYLFELFQGDVASWDGDIGPVYESIELGKRTKEMTSFFDVVTDEQTYIVFLADVPVDTQNPDNAGLYALRVVKAEDEETQLTYAEDMMVPGIYMPK